MALREVFARFGIEVDDAKLKHADETVNGFVEKLQKVGALLVGGEVVKGVFEFAKSISETGDELAKNAIRLGISGERLQALGFAAGQSGATVEGLKIALLSLSDRMQLADQGSKETAASFAKLGIKVKDSTGQLRNSDDVLLDAAEAISKVKSPTEQAALAMDLFGRQGRELLPFLKEGRKGIEELTDQAAELGGGFSGEALKASEEYNDALGRLNFGFSSLKGKIAQLFLPVMQKVIDATTKAVGWFTKIARETYIVETALTALGVALVAFGIRAAAAIAPALAPFVLWGALIGGILLIAEDLVVWFKGGKSAFGELLTAIFGAEKAKGILTWVRDAVKSISEWVSSTARDFRDFLRWVDEALDKLNRLIGLRNAALAKGTPEQQRDAIRRQAVAAGNTVRFPGETAEQAAAANAAAKAQFQAPQTVSAPGGGVTVNANVSAPVSITAANADAREVRRLVEDHVDNALDGRNKAAALALTREAAAK